MRTIIVVTICMGVLIYANLVPSRIPWGCEGEEDGYMIKTGWPCAFREQTRHNLYWEWKDFSIDVTVAVVALSSVAIGSEWVLRSRQSNSLKSGLFTTNYSTYLLLVLELAVLMAINLHERIVAFDSDYDYVRGWPMTALISGDFLFHNQVQPVGLLVNCAVAIVVLVVTTILARTTWERQK